MKSFFDKCADMTGQALSVTVRVLAKLTRHTRSVVLIIEISSLTAAALHLAHASVVIQIGA